MQLEAVSQGRRKLFYVGAAECQKTKKFYKTAKEKHYRCIDRYVVFKQHSAVRNVVLTAIASCMYTGYNRLRKTSLQAILIQKQMYMYM